MKMSDASTFQIMYTVVSALPEICVFMVTLLGIIAFIDLYELFFKNAKRYPNTLRDQINKYHDEAKSRYDINRSNISSQRQLPGLTKRFSGPLPTKK